jgi:hypothetical protein
MFLEFRRLRLPMYVYVYGRCVLSQLFLSKPAYLCLSIVTSWGAPLVIVLLNKRYERNWEWECATRLWCQQWLTDSIIKHTQLTRNTMEQKTMKYCSRNNASARTLLLLSSSTTKHFFLALYVLKQSSFYYAIWISVFTGGRKRLVFNIVSNGTQIEFHS